MSSQKVQKVGSRVVLSGFLDENSDLKVLESLTGKSEIDFKSVTRVNSCGVREWVNLIKKLPAAELSYVECPMVVVKQINAVPDFLGTAKVLSFYGPYFCENCDEEELKLIQVGDVSNAQPPQLKCSTCSKDLSFDAIPGQYFSFLKRT